MTGPERTDDGRYIIVKGRRWRATDPILPEELAAQLRSHLGTARSSIRTAADDSEVLAWRRRVQLAKEGLGERGDAWWDLSEQERLERARERLRSLEDSSRPRD